MIYGERIRLRAPEREDIPRFVAWLNDPEVRYGLSLYLPISIAEEERWFEDMLKRPKEERSFVMEYRDEGSWRPIGNCSYMNLDWQARSGEVGIFIGEKRLWNQGLGTEAMQILLRHGFETLNLNRVYLRVMATNLGAIRAYEKAGFIHEGRFRQAMYKDGKYTDLLYMSVLQCEWK